MGFLVQQQQQQQQQQRLTQAPPLDVLENRQHTSIMAVLQLKRDGKSASTHLITNFPIISTRLMEPGLPPGKDVTLSKFML
jgi:hypothetical protein